MKYNLINYTETPLKIDKKLFMFITNKGSNCIFLRNIKSPKFYKSTCSVIEKRQFRASKGQSSRIIGLYFQLTVNSCG